MDLLIGFLVFAFWISFALVVCSELKKIREATVEQYRLHRELAEEVENGFARIDEALREMNGYLGQEFQDRMQEKVIRKSTEP